jgi:endonuclease/exonuclease/phosphatase family metal-dependent hydrolase
VFRLGGVFVLAACGPRRVLDGPPGGESPPEVTLGTWNLETFSREGVSDPRIENLAGEIESLAPDLLALQELATNESGLGSQAFDALVAALPSYEGIRNPWQSWDTAVGLLYRPDAVSVLSTEELFADDPLPFPRPPLRADVRIGAFDLTVIVVHLKAYDDGLERRRDACAALDAYIRTTIPDTPVILVGDFNDDPHEPAATNAFAGTFLDREPDYWFLTGDLPPESVTETAYWHEVGGEYVAGTFLDHAVATGEVVEAYPRFTASIDGVDESEWNAWQALYSDHFPVVVSLAR